MVGSAVCLLFILVLMTACAASKLPGTEITQTALPLVSSSPTTQATLTSSPSPTATPIPWATLIKTPAHTPIPNPVDLVSVPDLKATYLLLGSDRRANETFFKTDAIVLVFLRTDGNISMVSIPRNTMVYIPGHEVFYINWTWYSAVLAHEDPFKLMADTLQYNFGVRPVGYAMIEFGHFITLIDELGGIDVMVSKDFYHSEIDVDSPVAHMVHAGLVHMDGETALWYSRARISLNDDINRGCRQQEVISALYTRAVENLKISDLATYWHMFNGLLQTNLSLADSESGFLTVKKPPEIGSYSMRSAVTEWWEPETSTYFLVPDPEKVRELLLVAASNSRQVEPGLVSTQEVSPCK